MPDKITSQLLEDLKDRNFTTGTTQSPMPEEGATLYDQLSKDIMADVTGEDKKSGVIHGVGAGVWNLLDAALIGLPGAAYRQATGEEAAYGLMSGETEGLGTVGAVIGQAAGFLMPLGWISRGVRAGVSSVNKLGTASRITKAGKKAGIAAGKSENLAKLGLSKELADQSVQKAIKDPSIAGGQWWKPNFIRKSGPLEKYEISLEEIAKVENGIAGSILQSLKKDFPRASLDELEPIANAAVKSLKKKGVHINNLSDIIEPIIGRKLPFAAKSSVATYAARAAEQGVSFSIYNLLTDGVLSATSDKEFDPIGDVVSGFMFSALLPLIDMKGGGGKMHIVKEAKRLFDTTKVFKKKLSKGDYDKMSAEQANGLLQILTRDNYLKDTVGKTTKDWITTRNRKNGSLDREEAINAIKKIIGDADINKMWKTFSQDAKEDFTASIGRMLLGGLIFDLNVLFDWNLINAMPADEIVANMLVGAYYSRIHRPLRPEVNPTLNATQKNIKYLEYMGLDASALEPYSRAFSKDFDIAAAYSGMLENPQIRNIEQIFDNKENREQFTGVSEETGTRIRTEEPIGAEGLSKIKNEDKIVMYAHDLYRMASFSRNIQNARDGEVAIKLEDLTPSQIKKISKKLKNLDVYTNYEKFKKDLETGKVENMEKLNIFNFHEFSELVNRNAIESVGINHMEAARHIADVIGLKHDGGQADLDIDKPLRIGSLKRIINKDNYTDPNMRIIGDYKNLLDSLDNAGLIEYIAQTEKELITSETMNNQTKDGDDIDDFIKQRLDILMKRTTKEFYGDDYQGSIDLHDNGFLAAVQNYKHQKKKNALYKMAENKRESLSDADKALYDVLAESFGDKSPLLTRGQNIRVVKDDKTSDDLYNDALKTADLQKSINQLALMWSTGGNRKPGELEVAPKNKINYSDAASIVGQFEAAGYKSYLQDDRFIEDQKKWHYARLLESPHLTTKHLSILDTLRVHGFAEVQRDDKGTPFLIIPDRDSVRNGLVNLGLDRGPQIDPYLKKYDATINALEKVMSDYVRIEEQARLEQVDNMIAAIDDAYAMTFEFDTQFRNEYIETINNNNSDSSWYNDLKNLNDSLFEPDPNKEGQKVRKVITEKNEADKITESINLLIKEKPKEVSNKFVETLEAMKETVNQEQMDQAEVMGIKSIAKAIETRIGDELDPIIRQNQVLEDILWTHENFSYDQTKAVPRNNAMIKRMVQYFNDEKLGSPITSKKLNLSQIVDEFNKRGHRKKATEHLMDHINMWKLHQTESEYFAQQNREAASHKDASQLYTKSKDDISASNIAARYGQYNESLLMENYNTLIDQLVESDYLSQKYGSSKTGKRFQNLFISEIKNIIKEVEEAIKVKHFNDIPFDQIDELKVKEYNKEIESFKQNTLPQLLSSKMGRKAIPSMKLIEREPGEYSLEVGNVTVGKGLLSDFRDEKKDPKEDGTLGDDGYDIGILEKSAEIGGSAKDLLEIKNENDQLVVDEKIEKAAIHSSADIALLDAASGKERLTESLESFSMNFAEPVRIITSQNNQLIVSRKQMEDGRLYRDFKKWYDKKMDLYDKKIQDSETDSEKTQIERAKRNLKSIYGEYVKDENLKKPATQEDIRQLIRIQYWDKLSSNYIDEILSVAGDKSKVNAIGEGFFKYVSLGEATGAKSQMSKRFFETIKNLGYSTKNQVQAIDDYSNGIRRYEYTDTEGNVIEKKLKVDKNKARVVSIADESGGKDNPMNAVNIIISKLKEQGVDEQTIKSYEAELKKPNGFLRSANSSSINAQSYLGTTFGRLSYLAKGRDLDDPEYGTAGVKPTGWFNDGVNSLLLKTNFVYDPVIAEILDTAGIDIITSESATKRFTKKQIEIDKKQWDKLLKDGKPQTASEAIKLAKEFVWDLKNEEIGDDYLFKIDLENIFLGKVEDRKTLTNATYALTDFLPTVAYDQFLVFGGYEASIKEHLGDLGSIVLGGPNRLAGAYSIMQEKLDRGELHPTSSDGLTNQYLRAGLDPLQQLVNPNIERMATLSIIKALRKPKVKGASNSILVPFLEGDVPIYKNVDGEEGSRKQIQVGGKKLSYLDSLTVIEDKSKLQYIVSWKDNNGKRDLQIGREDGKGWVIEDPEKKLKANDIKDVINVVEKIENNVFDNLDVKYRTMGKIHNKLMQVNEGSGGLRTKIYDVKVDMYENPEIRDKTGDAQDVWVVDDIKQAQEQLASIKKGLGKGKKFANKIRKFKDHYILKHKDGDDKHIYIKGTEPEELKPDPKGRVKGKSYFKEIGADIVMPPKGDAKIYLHSLSLRMPNLGGDVAVHKVQGFWDKAQGNVVGVNVFDIAQIHQADFDVDAMLSYHQVPNQMSKQIYKASGASVDAYQYESEEGTMDFFGNGDATLRPAGSANAGFGDNLDRHMLAFNQSKKNFGAVKKLSTPLSAFIRQPDIIKVLNKEGDGIVVNNIPDISKDTSTEALKKYTTFLQGYKNVLQSIIDAAKRPNWASEANSKEITRYILFGPEDTIPAKYNLQRESDKNEAYYHQEGFKGFFDITETNIPRKEVIKDGIVEMVRTLSLPQRVLTDVWDSSGRRPPDSREIQDIRNELSTFMNAPNVYIFKRLRSDRAGKKDELLKLYKVFFDVKEITEKDFKGWLKQKKWNTVPTKTVFDINPRDKNKLKDSSVASHVTWKLDPSLRNLTGKNFRQRTFDASKGNKVVSGLLERIDTATMLSGDNDYGKIRDILDENDGEIQGDFLRKYIDDFSKGEQINKNQILRYSLFFKDLQSQKNSIYKTLRYKSKSRNPEYGRELRKLAHIESLIRYYTEQESKAMESLHRVSEDPKRPLHEKFWIQKYTVSSKRPKKVINNNSDNHWYIYRKNQKTNEMKITGMARAKSKFIIQRSGDYYAVKNPIREEKMSSIEHMDNLSLILTTGDIQVEMLGFKTKHQQDQFILSFDELKRTIGSLASDTYKESKDNVSGRKNWAIQAKLEEAFVGKFLKRHLKNIDHGETTSYTETPLADLVRWMIKPELVPGSIVVDNDKSIRLPSFKQNTRLHKAVSRYLRNNGHSALDDAITKRHGDLFRKMKDGILPENEDGLFKSRLYVRDSSDWTKSENEDYNLAMSLGWMDNIGIQEYFKHPLAARSSRAKEFYDINGNLSYIYRYSRYKLFKNNGEFFNDPYRTDSEQVNKDLFEPRSPTDKELEKTKQDC